MVQMKSASGEDQSSDDEDADLLLKWFEEYGEGRDQQAGEILMSAGEAPHWMARIDSGIAAVLDVEGAESHTLTVGDLFGELGLVGNRTRTATVQAVSQVSLKVLSYQTIDRFCGGSLEKRSSFDRALSELIASRVPDPLGPDGGWIALVAHDQKKDPLEKLVGQYRETLLNYKIVSTRTTGSRLSTRCQLPVRKLVCSGPLGGDLEIGAMAARGQLEAVIFLRDGLSSHAHGSDIDALVRACEIAEVPCATNRATAQMVLQSLPNGNSEGSSPC